MAESCAPDTDATPTDLLTALRRAMLAGERFRRAVAEELDLGLSESIALSHLSIAGPLTIGELSDQLRLTPSSLTSVVDRLEAGGLAHRQASRRDRRLRQVSITDRGADLIERQQHRIGDALADIRRPGLADALVSLADKLDEQADAAAARTGNRDARSSG